MADFTACIQQALSNRQITKAVADQLIAAPDIEAELNSMVSTLSRQKRETAIAATRIAQAWENASNHPAGAYEGVLSLLSKDRTGQAGYSNVEYLQKTIVGKYHSQLVGMLQRFRTRRLGWYQDQKGLAKLVRAIYREETDDAQLNAFAKQWHEMAEVVRTQFNAKGGSIHKNDNWIMPQHHDARALMKVGKDQWKRDILPMLDTGKMLDDAGKPLSSENLDEALDYVFETITTGGLNKTKDLTVPRLGKKMARRHNERRFLYFKDADAWLKYQKDYGRGDVFTTLTGHLDSMASDIALMETFGPSPESTFKALVAQLEKGKMVKGHQKAYLQAVYNNVSGKTSQGELTSLSDFMQANRNILVASTLGRAFLSAVSDLGFQAVTASYNNIPAWKVLRRHMSTMTDEANQVFAVRMGLVAESMINRMHAANRYADVYGTGPTAKIAESVMRASLLQPWTDAGRKAFGMEFSAMLAENFSKSFDELPEATLRGFKQYGIGPDDWDLFRTSSTLDHKGAKFADLTAPGGTKFHQMVLSEMDFAVPTPDAKVQAITNGGLGRGTIEGQAWRSAMMLKSFPATIIMTHFYRAAYQSTMAGKLKYLAAITAATTVLGGVSLQMKDIGSGRDPRPMDAKFLAAAVAQGGGLGIFGDFVFSDQNRFGGGITETLTGPVGEQLDTAAKFTIGNIQEAIAGEETHILGEAVQIVDRYTPDVWQTYLFTNALFDQLELLADPKAQKRFNRVTRKRQNDFNQDYWWRPGEITPDRVPDFGNLMEE